MTVDARVLQVEPNAERVAKTTVLGVYAPYLPGPIAAGEGAVWVAVLER